MVTEVTIRIKDEDSTFRQKFLMHSDTEGDLTLSHDNLKLKSMVDQVISNFKGTPEEILVKAEYLW